MFIFFAYIQIKCVYLFFFAYSTFRRTQFFAHSLFLCSLKIQEKKINSNLFILCAGYFFLFPPISGSINFCLSHTLFKNEFHALFILLI